jgi:hypothetical protein
LSPYFAEDFKHMRPSWASLLGKRRLAAFEGLRFDTLSKTINPRTVKLFAGDKEIKSVLERWELAHHSLFGSQAIKIPGVGHDVAKPAYLRALKEAIS